MGDSLILSGCDTWLGIVLCTQVHNSVRVDLQ